MSSNRPRHEKRGPSGPLFFALAFLLLSTVSAFAADPLLSWITSPEAYYATPDELAKWKSEVVSPADAQRFIDEYWRKRGEGFRKEVHTRLEFADSKFGLGKTPGSQTAMGEVFMILGSPNEQKTTRGGTLRAPSAGPDPMAGRMQDSAIEQGANIINTWVYKKDRLPADLGIAELRVDFVTDVSRGKQVIDNSGNVIPFLRRAAANLSAKAMHAATAIPATPSHPAGTDPLWNATPALNGAAFSGDAFVSPREEPFYALSFFIPKDATAFKEWKSVLAVSLIRDASGKEIVASREQAELRAYDDNGDRYTDRSFALAPGSYEGMFALYSPDGITLLSSNRETFEVAAADKPRASKLFLTSHIDTLDAQASLDPFTFVAQKYAVRGDRRFRPSDKIAFFTVITADGSSTPRLMQKLTLTRDGKVVADMPLEPAQPAQTGPKTFLIGVGFDPGSFKPGHYSVELQVHEYNAAAGSELRSQNYVLTNEFDVQ